MFWYKAPTGTEQIIKVIKLYLRSTETCFVAPSSIYENKFEDYPFVVAMKLNQWTKTSDDALQSN